MRRLLPAVLAVSLAACFLVGAPPERPDAGEGGGSGGFPFFVGGGAGASGGGAVGGGPGGGGGVAGGGSGAGGAGPTEAVSGTRLKALVLRSPDGLELFSGWRDTQLGTTCWFWLAADGERRCAPSTATYAVDGFFSDAQCTAPAYRGQTCAPPTLFYRYDQSTCPMRWAYFQVGARLTQRQLFYKSGTSCSQLSLSAEESAWAVGPAVAPATFVRGIVTEPAGAAGVGLKTITADDGARGPYGTKDLARNVDCTWGTLDDGATHCFPQDYAWASTSYAADATCSTPGVLVGPSACPPPAWTVGSAPGCSSRFTMGQRGAELSAYYTRSGTQCVAQAPPAQYRVFASVPVAASAFPVATITRAGAGRLQLEQLVWPGGLTLPGNAWDTQLGASCSPWYIAADGLRRCLPSFSSAWENYADVNCTQRLVEGGAACPPGWAATWDVASCGASARVHLFPVTGAHSGPVYRKSGTTCDLTTVPAGAAYFRLGAERPATDFVPFTEAQK